MICQNQAFIENITLERVRVIVRSHLYSHLYVQSHSEFKMLEYIEMTYH